jgi:hypothetical protein
MCSPKLPDPPPGVATSEAPESATIKGRKKRGGKTGMSGLRIPQAASPGGGMGSLLAALLIPGQATSGTGTNMGSSNVPGGASQV